MSVFDFENLILSEKIFGLELVDNKAKVLELKHTRGKYKVVGFGEEMFNPSAFSSGIIVSPNEIAEAIKLARLKAKPRKVRRQYASVVLPDSKIFIRTIKFPLGMKKEDIKEAIEWKAKDLIAMPLEKVYWDWHRLKKRKGKGEVEVVISAVEKKCADSFSKTLGILNITPLYYDISGNAAARFTFQDDYKTKRALLIRIDRYSSTISLFLDGGVRYQTVLEGAEKGGGFSHLIDFTALRLGLQESKAEEVLFTPKSRKLEQEGVLKENFEKSFDTLAGEATQILDYYKQKLYSGGKKESDISEIYFYGKGANTIFLNDFFAKKFAKMKILTAKKSSFLSKLPFVNKANLSESVIILGLSLRNFGNFKQLRDINLVPDKIKKKYISASVYKNLNTYLRMVFWSVFLLGIVMFVTYLFSSFYKRNVLQELKATKNISESPANQQIAKDIDFLNKSAIQINKLFESQKDWDRFFSELSGKRVKGVTLSSIYLSEDENVWSGLLNTDANFAKPGNYYVTISGNAKNRQDLQQYVDNLENGKLFEAMRMPISNYEKRTNIEFTLFGLINKNSLSSKNETK